jgi:hypothetical protein
VFLFVTLIAFLREVEGTEIACESVRDGFWGGIVTELKICIIDEATTIEARDATFSASDEPVNSLNFSGNKKIRFLPILVADKYPDLLLYDASGCSLKEVTKQNFEGLSKLKALFLNKNEIEKINSDTFEDLLDLEDFYLGEITL